LGVEERVVKRALGAVLCFLNKKQEQGTITKDNFETILSVMGGGTAKEWMEDERQYSSHPQQHQPITLVGLIFFLLQLFGIWTLLKGLLQKYSATFGLKLLETMEDGFQLDQLLARLGITHEQGIVLVGMLVEFIKQKLTPETVQNLLQHIPALQAFLDESKKRD